MSRGLAGVLQYSCWPLPDYCCKPCWSSCSCTKYPIVKLKHRPAVSQGQVLGVLERNHAVQNSSSKACLSYVCKLCWACQMGKPRSSCRSQVTVLAHLTMQVLMVQTCWECSPHENPHISMRQSFHYTYLHEAFWQVLSHFSYSLDSQRIVNRFWKTISWRNCGHYDWMRSWTCSDCSSHLWVDLEEKESKGETCKRITSSSCRPPIWWKACSFNLSNFSCILTDRDATRKLILWLLQTMIALEEGGWRAWLGLPRSYESTQSWDPPAFDISL